MATKPATTIALLLAALSLAPATGAGAGAQSTSGGGAQPRPATRVRVLGQRERIVRQMDVLQRRLASEELPPGERERLVEELSNLALRLAVLERREDMEPALLLERSEAPTLLEAQRRLAAEGVPRRWMPKGWVGINVAAPHSERFQNGEHFVRFFEYPLVVSVDPSSPADVAGIRRGDTLLAYNGTDVKTEVPMGRLLVPNARLAVRLRRDGEVRDVAVRVAPAPENVVVRRWEFNFPEGAAMVAGSPPPPAAPMSPTPPTRVILAPGAYPAEAPRAPRTRTPEGLYTRVPAPPGVAFVFAENALMGARIETVSRELSEAMGISRGVLVLEVAAGSPAAESGLRTGDVILRAAGRDVTAVPVLRALMRQSEARELPLELRRKGAKRTVTLRW